MTSRLILAAAFACAAPAQDLMLSRFSPRDYAVSADPGAEAWRRMNGVVTSHDRYGKPVAGARTEIRSYWTGRYLAFLFISNFQNMRLQPKPTPDQETWGLWDFDVVEVFIGHDLERIGLYKEFEVSPQNEWVDLDVDRNRKGREVDWLWNSGFRFLSRIDERNKTWYCEMQIPWPSIAAGPAAAGQQFRLNLYRIEGSDPDRKYITWQPVHSPSYHTPERFGRLRLEGK